MLKPLKEIFPPPEEALQLPPEELAGFLLEYLKLLESEQRDISRYNVTMVASLQDYAGKSTDEMRRAVTAAWVWLEREGMIAPSPDSPDGSWSFITRRGRSLRSHQDFGAYRRGNLLPRENLDPELLQKVWPLFISGDYETALFSAFKLLEVRIREAAKLTPGDLGVDLARKAFNAETGPLMDKAAEKGEREALAHIMAGCLGFFKNPTSHRKVTLRPEETAEAILFANHLLRIIEERSELTTS